jgi:drug/metabolite transporter (DMT)-like permease
MAIPVLGEWPQKQDWAAIVLISAGVYIVSGGPLPRGLKQQHNKAEPTASSSAGVDR